MVQVIPENKIFDTVYVTEFKVLKDKLGNKIFEDGHPVKKQTDVQANLRKIIGARRRLFNQNLYVVGTAGNYEIFNKVMSKFRSADVLLPIEIQWEPVTRNEQQYEQMRLVATIAPEAKIDFEELTFGILP